MREGSCFLLAAETLGFEFREYRLDFRAILHFADQAEPPWIFPGDNRGGRFVVPFGVAPLNQAEVVTEAEAEVAGEDSFLEELAKMLCSFGERSAAWELFGRRRLARFLTFKISSIHRVVSHSVPSLRSDGARRGYEAA